MPLTPGERYWAPHEEHAFLPALYSGPDGGDAVFSDTEGVEFKVPMERAKQLDSVSEAQLEGVDNVCLLEEVNQAAVMHTVRTRYRRSPPEVYTRVAKIMIAVNPFQNLPIYSAGKMKQYLDAADSIDLEPHIFGIGSDAVKGLQSEERKNQAVLISGESGSGKTETTKLILSYVSEALVGSSGGIQDKIMQTNPILESFGNAMTVRNNNSSRFGKWQQIVVDSRCAIRGCSVTDYLLELTRVCAQGPKERNYHIFFQLLKAKDQLPGISMKAPSDYRYIRDAQHVAPNVDDLQFFEELKAAFGTMGFSEADQKEIFSVVIGILTLGNAVFDADGEASKLQSDAPVSEAATLLGMDVALLKAALTKRQLKVGADITVTGRSAAQAGQARDALARLLYGRLFKQLIAKINLVLADGGDMSGQYFGVLDIAGFESFEVNSIEQLFINLSNEHLQGHFNNHVFKMELDDYAAEGIDAAAALTYQDNSDIIALLDSKASILATLDEEVSVPRANDDTFTAKVIKNFSGHPRFYKPKVTKGKEFGVRHFAGEVLYTTDGFLEKNVDKPPDEAASLLLASKVGVLRDIGAAIEKELSEANAPGKKKLKTVSSGFRASLVALMSTLSQADPNFVRCIKPNQEKVPNKFSAHIALEQLSCSGVFEAVRIRQSGYATRVVFAEFLGRYRTVLPKAKALEIKQAQGAGASDVDCAKMFLQQLPSTLEHFGKYDPNDIALGKTKVFARTKVVIMLDRAREFALTRYVVDIQRLYRGHRARKTMKACRVVFAEVHKWHQANNFYGGQGPEHTAIHRLKTGAAIDAQLAALEPLLEKARKMPLRCPREKEIENFRRRMHNESDAVKGLAAAAKSLEPLEIEKVVARCQDLSIVLPEVQQLHARFEALKAQVPLIKGAQVAIRDADIEAMAEILSSAKALGLTQAPEKWLPELKGKQAMDELFNVHESTKAAKKLEEKKEHDHQEAEAKLKQNMLGTKAKDEAFEVHAPPPRPSKKEERRKRKSTIAGLTEEEASKIQLELIAAMEVCDMGRLEEALNDAIKQGMADHDVSKEAQEMYRNLSSEEWLARTLADKTAELDSRGDEGTLLRSLQNLLKQAEQLQAAPEAVAAAKTAVQAKVRARARKTITGKVFDQIDVEEMGIIDSSFANLADFSGLKSPADWRGHKSPGFFTFGMSGADAMLIHNKMDLKDPLTTVPTGLETQCINAYHNILGWMYDRPVPEVQRAHLMQEVVTTAMQDTAMADEIYCQVMKQLTNNPSTRSQVQGWKMLHSLCQHVCPSSTLYDFVHVFLMKAMRSNDDNHEVLETIKQCIADLNMTAAPPEGAKVDADMEVLQVMLIDSSVRRVRAPVGSTLLQLGEIAAEQLKIGKANDFAFFQVTEGLQTHRLLPDTAVISSILQKWQKLQEVTNRSSQLLFKRKFIRVDEYLQAGDLSHATLTYQQAVWDFLHYPIQEDLKTMVDIAVCIMFVERDHFQDYVAKGKIADPGVLEQVLPETTIREGNRKKIAQQVSETYQALRDTMDPGEHRLVAMTHAFSLMQRLRLFGAFYWMGRQISEVPSDKISVPEAPKATCNINPKAPDADYWIAVDFFGVRFVSAGTQPGTLFQKGFLFNEEAVERVLIWGANQNVVQFVVSTVNPAMPHVGRVPMTIAMHSPAAVDVAYAVHLIYSMKGMADKHKRQAARGG